MKKVYIIRKYVVARNAKHAISLDKKSPVDDCWLEETSQKTMIEDINKKEEKQAGYKLIHRR